MKRSQIYTNFDVALTSSQHHRLLLCSLGGDMINSFKFRVFAASNFSIILLQRHPFYTAFVVIKTSLQRHRPLIYQPFTKSNFIVQHQL